MSARLLLIPIILPLISACASLGWNSDVKKVEVQTKAVERTPLNLREPTPFRSREVDWMVVTPDNINEVWKRLRESHTDLVLFAVTDDGYENLAITMAELRSIITQQRSIIIKYKEYYEPGQPDKPAK